MRRTALLEPEARRVALRDRLKQLVGIFAIDVLEWALLSNHFHLVAATHPDLVAFWSDEEVARRWRTLSPDYAWRRRMRVDYSLPAQDEEIAAALKDPDLIACWRVNLADLSVFHKFLKQRLARLINVQDDVTGHCFEGRFKSIVAIDEDAVIAHMVYVALNPVRASMSDSLEGYEFCSIAARVQELKARIASGEFAGEVEEAKKRVCSMMLVPAMPCEPGEEARRTDTLRDGRRNLWCNGRSPSLLDGTVARAGIGLVAFLSYVEAVGRAPRFGKRGTIGSATPSSLAGLEHVLSRSFEPSEAQASLERLRPFVDTLELAMSRGPENPIGNFSGSVESLARTARETGRQCVAAVAGLAPAGPRRVSAAPCADA